MYNLHVICNNIEQYIQQYIEQAEDDQNSSTTKDIKKTPHWDR